MAKKKRKKKKKKEKKKSWPRTTPRTKTNPYVSIKLLLDVFPVFPVELIRKIRFFTLPRQNENLLRDIVHFKPSLEIVRKILRPPMSFQPHLLLNDLWMYIIKIMRRFPLSAHSSKYKIWLRMFRIHNIKSAEHWVRTCYAVKSTKIQIRLVWAVFTPEERIGFISWQKKVRGFIV